MAVTTPPSGGGEVDGLDDIQVTLDAPFLGEPMEVPIVSMDKVEGTGKIEENPTQCGEVTAEKSGNLPLSITIRGEGHLRHAKAIADFWRTGTAVEVTSLIASGSQFFVTDMTLREDDDKPKLELGNKTARRIGFQVQLQTSEAT